MLEHVCCGFPFHHLSLSLSISIHRSEIYREHLLIVDCTVCTFCGQKNKFEIMMKRQRSPRPLYFTVVNCPLVFFFSIFIFLSKYFFLFTSICFSKSQICLCFCLSLILYNLLWKIDKKKII